jgi:hypothetical protein
MRACCAARQAEKQPVREEDMTLAWSRRQKHREAEADESRRQREAHQQDTP